MTRTSTYLLATFTGLALAACGPRRSDTNAAPGTGSETGATGSTGSAYDTTQSKAPATPADTSHAGMDTSHARTDTTAK
jgi:hypothetical protein